MQKTKEIMAVQTLAAAASLYLNTLDDFAKPIVSAQLQNCIDILMVKIRTEGESGTENE